MTVLIGMKLQAIHHFEIGSSELVEGVRLDDYTTWGKKAGIRAQLLDVKKRSLEMDFVMEGDERSMHVLNAVSPAVTCSLPFSDYLCDRIRQFVNGSGWR